MSGVAEPQLYPLSPFFVSEGSTRHFLPALTAPRLHARTHDFNAMLRLPPGQYRLKFIVDDSWRCSKQIPTATDDDGTLVNWLEVEAPKTEEEMKAEWALDAKPSKADDGELNVRTRRAARRS